VRSASACVNNAPRGTLVLQDDSAVRDLIMSEAPASLRKLESFNTVAWDSIGNPSKETLQAWKEVERLPPSLLHSGTMCSEKNRKLGEEPYLAEHVRHAKTHMAQFLPPDPLPVEEGVKLRADSKAQTWQAQKRIQGKAEAGCASRFLMKSAQGSLPNPKDMLENHLEKVACGMAWLRGKAADKKMGKKGPNRSCSEPALVEERFRPMEIDLVGEETIRLPAKSMLAESRTPASRQARRAESRGKLGLLNEFSIFCSTNFDGSTEKAWEAIDERRVGSVHEAAFVAALVREKYPSGQLGLKSLFFFLDCDDDSMVSIEDIERALDEVSMATMQTSQQKRSKKSKARFSMAPNPLGEEAPHVAEAMDVFESTHTFSSASGGLSVRAPKELDEAEVIAARRRLAERLSQKEPIVGEFITELFNTFKTIRVAFRHMDLNKNGTISISEFMDMLKRPNSKKGKSVVEAHIETLWCHIKTALEVDPHGKNRVDVDILRRSLLEGVVLFDSYGAGDGVVSKTFKIDDAFVLRLGGFCQEESEKMFIISSGEFRRKWFERLFTPSGGKWVGFGEFTLALSQLRYADWHIKSLFHSLDKDASGMLDVGEFASLLEMDARVGRQPGKYQRPIGSEKRQAQVGGLDSAMFLSPKMQNRQGVRLGFGDEGRHERRKVNASGGDYSSMLYSGFQKEQFGMSMKCDRPDHVATIRRMLPLNSASELHDNGAISMNFNTEKHRDLLAWRGSGHQIETFAVDDRSRVSERS